MKKNFPKCECVGKCFARKNGECTILKETSNACNFQKPDMEFTNGVYYKFVERKS